MVGGKATHMGYVNGWSCKSLEELNLKINPYSLRVHEEQWISL